MGNSSYVRTGLCPGFVGSSGKSLGLKLRARLPLYSPTFREHKFSETRIQPCESLCVRTGAKPDLCTARYRTLPLDIGGMHIYLVIALPRTGAVPYAGAMRSAPDASINGSSDRLATVVEAAEILGITPDAIRSRLRRGTLKRSPKRGEDGEVLVVMPAPKNANQSGDKSETVSDQSTGQSATDRDLSPTVPLVEEMREEVAFLREELRREREARVEEKRRHDTIVLQLAQRIPELEATPEPRGDPASPSEDSTNGESPEPEQRSWWRRPLEM